MKIDPKDRPFFYLILIVVAFIAVGVVWEMVISFLRSPIRVTFGGDMGTFADWWMFSITALLLLVGVAQLWMFKRQLDSMRAGLAHSTIAAQAAAQAVDAGVTAERAYIYVELEVEIEDLGNFFPVDAVSVAKDEIDGSLGTDRVDSASEDGRSEDDEGIPTDEIETAPFTELGWQFAAITCWARNYGKTPARLGAESLHTISYLPNRKPPLPPVSYWERRRVTPAVVGPGASAKILKVDYFVERNQIQKGNILEQVRDHSDLSKYYERLLIRGEVSYYDVFDVCHTVWFMASWEMKGRSVVLLEHSETRPAWAVEASIVETTRAQ